MLAEDVVAVAEGAGLLDARRPGRRWPATGSGRWSPLAAAGRSATRCAGLVLVDGGWEAHGAATGMDADEFLRGLDEPPEVMRSLAAFLADRRASIRRPGTPTRSAAARATVVETHAGRVVPATRPHALEAGVRAMFTYDPSRSCAAVAAPVVALLAADEDRRPARRPWPSVRGARRRPAARPSSVRRSGATATT